VEQLVARLAHNQKVIGSSPIPATTSGVSSIRRAGDFQSSGCGCKSHTPLQKIMNSSILVYSSIGDISSYFPLWKYNDLSYAFNYYGTDPSRKDLIKSNCDYFTNISGTKFNLFSKLYDSLPTYDYYVIIDDDINLHGSDMVNIVEVMKDNNYGVASPSHSSNGQISWNLMRSRKSGKVRESDFVEMTVVIFSREQLEIFLKAYQPYRDQMIGWGIDHIIHSVCKKPFLIFDNIVVTNPTNKQKGIKQREIQSYIDKRNPVGMWKKVLSDPNNNFVEYVI